MTRKAPKNCYWRGPVLWGRMMVGGNIIRWSLRTADSRIAAKRFAERQTREKAFIHFGEHRHRYEEAAAKWADWISGQVGRSTAKRYAVSLKQLERFLLPLFLDQIDTRKVGDIVKERRADGVSNATIRRDLGALSSVLLFSEAEGWRDDNPALNWLRRIRERRDPIILPEPEYIRRVAANAPGMLRSLIECAWATGCRLSELVNARRSQFDHSRKQLTIVGKRNKLRVIDLDGWGFDLLASLPLAMGQSWLFHDGGLPLRDVSSRFRNLVRAQMKAATLLAKGQQPDFRRFRFHDLRHRHAVDWLKSGRSIYDLQHRLGHTSVKTTEIYLIYLTSEEARTAKFGSVMGLPQ